MKIIVTSHGNLCNGIIHSYEMLAGKTDSIIAVPLDENDTGEFESKLTNIVNEIKGNILILCDIHGGTPYNVSNYLYHQQSKRIGLVSGLNLPMLLETGLSLGNNISLDEIVNVAINAGTESIQKAEEILIDEEDIF